MADITTIQRPQRWDMELKAGDTWPAWSFEVVDEDDFVITGFTVRMEIKNRDTDASAIKTLIGGDGFTVVGNLVTFDSEVDLVKGRYVYDIELTLDTGKVYTQYEGRIKVTQDVTD